MGLVSASLLGAYNKFRLLAQPSSLLAIGRNVIVQCVSKQQYDRFILIKQEPQKLSWTMNSQYNQSSGQFETLFSLSSLTINQKWTVRCYKQLQEQIISMVKTEPFSIIMLNFIQVHMEDQVCAVFKNPNIFSPLMQSTGDSGTRDILSQTNSQSKITGHPRQKYRLRNQSMLHSLLLWITFSDISFQSDLPPCLLHLEGTLHKSTIKAESGSVITSGFPMINCCQWTIDSEMYVLHKEEISQTWITQTLELTGNRVSFPTIL